MTDQTGDKDHTDVDGKAMQAREFDGDVEESLQSGSRRSSSGVTEMTISSEVVRGALAALKYGRR